MLEANHELLEFSHLRIEKTGKDVAPKWHSYFLCGVKGIFDHLGADQERRGLEVTLSGNVPPASGLSSSSALVSAAVLAIAYRHQVRFLISV